MKLQSLILIWADRPRICHQKDTVYSGRELKQRNLNQDPCFMQSFVTTKWNHKGTATKTAPIWKQILKMLIPTTLFKKSLICASKQPDASLNWRIENEFCGYINDKMSQKLIYNINNCKKYKNETAHINRVASFAKNKTKQNKTFKRTKLPPIVPTCKWQC